MAPKSSSSGRRSGKSTRRKPIRRSGNYKKKKLNVVKPKMMSSSSIQETSVLEDLAISTITSSDHHHHQFPINIEGVDPMISTPSPKNIASPCCTPKAQRFRIPQIETCPPPPKKQRLLSNCSLRTTPIAFFAPPDLELFFYTLADISV